MRIWVMAARVRTLPAAVAPVLVGTSLALGAGHFHPLAFVAALLGAVFIQVGTNLSNDYSDARRGADTEDRLGPVQGDRRRARAAPPGADRDVCDVRAGGAVRRLPGGGRRLGADRRRRRIDPRGRALHGRPAPVRLRGARRAVRVPVLRRSWRSSARTSCRSRSCPGRRSCCAVPVGLLASAILVVNNVRDLETDRRAGKRTLAVRLGRERTRACTRRWSPARSCARRCRGRSAR